MPLDKLNEIVGKAKEAAVDVANKAKAISKDVPELAKNVADKAKTTVVDSAEKTYDFAKKEIYSVEVNIDKKGITQKVKTNRPTRHTIKWRSKGH